MGTATPIIITVYPRNDGVLSRRLVVGIRIPTMYQQEPPTPIDSSIRIEERPGMTVYALYVTPLQEVPQYCSHFNPRPPRPPVYRVYIV